MERKTLVDHKSSSYLFFLVFIVYAFIYMTKNCYSAAMASIVADGVMTKSETGLITAVFYLVYAVFQIIGGIIADKIQPYKIILIGFIGAAISNTLICFANGYVPMLIIWSFNGMIQFGVWPGVFKMVTTELAPDHRVKCMFYILFASSVGLLFSYVVAMFASGWKYNFFFSAIVLYICSVVFYFGYKKIEKKMVPDKGGYGEIKRNKSNPGSGIVKLIITSGVPFLLVVYWIANMISLGLKALAPVMIMESYDGISASMANGLNIILVLVTPLGLLLSRTPIIRKLQPPAGMGVLALVSIPLLIVVTYIGKINVYVLLGVLSMVLLFMSPMTSYSTHISAAFTKYDSVATLSGILNAMASLGIVIANYVFAKIADNSGWVVTSNVWVILVVTATILAFMAIPAWRKFINK